MLKKIDWDGEIVYYTAIFVVEGFDMLKRTQFYQSIIGMIASASDVWELSLITRLVKKTSVPNGTNGAIADAIENKYPRIVPSQYHDYYKKVIEEIRAYDETEGDNMLDEAAEVGADIPN